MAGQQTGLVLGILLVQVLCVIGNTSCNWKYFKHYEQKRCEPVLGKNGCPDRFQCKELSDDDLRSCVHNGKLYNTGDEIKDAGPCDSCTCEKDEQGLAYINCAEVDCPDWEPRNKSCYMGEKPGECCPVEICPNGKDTSKACNYKGKDYKIGDYIQTSDPCKPCICTEKWAGENGPGCSKVNCLTGLYAKAIVKGCLPIYLESGCCFFEMNCGGVHGATPVTLTKDINKGNYCQHRGKYYERGSTVFLDNDKYQCDSCECQTPPDFTCIRKKCPPPPRSDCKMVYGHCCPNYQCP